MIIVKCLLFLVNANGAQQSKQAYGELLFHQGNRWVVDFTLELERIPDYYGPMVLNKRGNDCLVVKGKLNN